MCSRGKKEKLQKRKKNYINGGRPPFRGFSQTFQRLFSFFKKRCEMPKKTTKHDFNQQTAS